MKYSPQPIDIVMPSGILAALPLPKDAKVKTKPGRTTHSDLATLLDIYRAKIAAVPAGYCVSDAASLRLLEDTARILREQDARIDELTVGLRELGGVEARKYFRHRTHAAA